MQDYSLKLRSSIQSCFTDTTTEFLLCKQISDFWKFRHQLFTSWNNFNVKRVYFIYLLKYASRHSDNLYYILFWLTLSSLFKELRLAPQPKKNKSNIIIIVPVLMIRHLGQSIQGVSVHRQETLVSSEELWQANMPSCLMSDNRIR